MRSIQFILVIGLLLVYQQATAQRHRKGQFGVSAFGGFMDRIPGAQNSPGEAVWTADQQGFVGSLDFVRYTRQEHFWMIGLQYDVKNYRPISDKLLSERYTANFSYAPFSLHNYKRDFYLSPYVGVLSGVEIINRDKLNTGDGHIQANSAFSLGALAGMELEVFIVPSLSLLLRAEERFNAFSNLNKLHSQGSIGIRYTFTTLN